MMLKLPRSQRFACSKRDIKLVFPDDVLRWVSIVFFNTFDFDRRLAPSPKFVGPVIAQLSAGTEPTLSIFPVRIDQYPQSVAEEFKSEILPKMKVWLDGELTRSVTDIAGREGFAVEWTGGRHRCHRLRWR
jgi:hypothetical protein